LSLGLDLVNGRRYVDPDTSTNLTKQPFALSSHLIGFEFERRLGKKLNYVKELRHLTSKGLPMLLMLGLIAAVTTSGGGNQRGWFGQKVSAQASNLGWKSTGNLLTGRELHGATLLTDGRVLVAGGANFTYPANQSGMSLNTAELYDPVSGTWSTTGAMHSAWVSPRLIALRNGKALIAGGESAELFDGATGTWRQIECSTCFFGDMILLQNGKVLSVGSSSSGIYDPETNLWSSINNPISGGSLVGLRNGKILLIHGSSAELFDPTTNTWAPTGGLNTPGRAAGAVLLADGRVLMMGGRACSAPGSECYLRSAELYDVDTGTWRYTAGQMDRGIYPEASWLLPNGRVLVYGIWDASGYGPSYTVRLYDPATESWLYTYGSIFS
jgi:hypothetical protein